MTSGSKLQSCTNPPPCRLLKTAKLHRPAALPPSYSHPDESCLARFANHCFSRPPQREGFVRAFFSSAGTCTLSYLLSSWQFGHTGEGGLYAELIRDRSFDAMALSFTNVSFL